MRAVHTEAFLVADDEVGCAIALHVPNTWKVKF